MTPSGGIPCMLMRGGTSKGPVFLASDLPADRQERDEVLLSLMGSPDVRQIDGIGGGDSLTSQVLIVSRGSRSDADVDYLFAQVAVGRGEVDTTPNCGNMLSAVAAFAIERGLVRVAGGKTRVRMLNLNTGKLVHAYVPTRASRVIYQGEMRIDGVPGIPAPSLPRRNRRFPPVVSRVPWRGHRRDRGRPRIAGRRVRRVRAGRWHARERCERSPRGPDRCGS